MVIIKKISLYLFGIVLLIFGNKTIIDLLSGVEKESKPEKTEEKKQSSMFGSVDSKDNTPKQEAGKQATKPKMPVQANNLYKAQVRWLFHSHIKIKIPATTNESVFDTLYSIYQDVDKKYNSYSDGSDIDLINKNAGDFTLVNDETVEILKRVIYLSDFLDDEYDITIMPLIRLWQFYTKGEKKLPTENEIKDILGLIDYKKIEITNRKVKINHNQEIITGSFIKAYATDKIVKKLLQHEISDAIINAGGSTIKAVNNIFHPFWKVNIFHPDDETDLLFKLKIGNACISTSAQSKTFVEINGQRYGHIMSPKTGYPSQNKQIGIITEDCFTGDILSTGLYNLDFDKFEEKINMLAQYFPVSGYLIDKYGKIKFVGGFEKYIE